MCIAIYKEAGYTLSDDALKNSWDANSDGAGFMYAEDGEIKIVKGLMTYDKFLEAYKPHEMKQMVLHFRIGTHGNKDEANTHPFAVSSTLGLVHNGIISNIKCDINKDMSDTWHFVEKIMKQYEEYWQEPSFQALIECFIGYSKLILLDGQGNFAIYNEQSGVWDGENNACWFSNTSYKTKTYQYGNCNKGKNKGNSYKGSWAENEEYDDNFNSTTTKVGDYKQLVFDEDAIGQPKGVVIPKGSKVQVEAFGEGMFLWVVCREEASPCYGWRAKVGSYSVNSWQEPQQCCLPLKKKLEGEFEVGKEVVFAYNYNHFRIGDKAVIESIGVNNLLLSDPNVMSNKSYLVDSSYVRPMRDLLLN